MMIKRRALRRSRCHTSFFAASSCASCSRLGGPAHRQTFSSFSTAFTLPWSFVTRKRSSSLLSQGSDGAKVNTARRFTSESTTTPVSRDPWRELPRPFMKTASGFTSDSTTGDPWRELPRPFNETRLFRTYHISRYNVVCGSEREETAFDLRARVGGHARDLIGLDAGYIRHSSSDLLRGPLVNPRRNALVVSLSHVQLIVTPNEVTLFNPDRPVVTDFRRQLVHFIESYCESEREGKRKGRIETEGEVIRDVSPRTAKCDTTSAEETPPQDRAGCIPDAQLFPMLVLEAVLLSVSEKYSRRVSSFQPVVTQLTEQLTTVGSMDELALHRLIPIKRTLRDFGNAIESTVDFISELLQNDEEMALIAAVGRDVDRETVHNTGRETDVLNIPTLTPEQIRTLHIPTEELLETYYYQYLSILGELPLGFFSSLWIGFYSHEPSTCTHQVRILHTQIQAGMDAIRLSLAHRRNNLLSMQVHATLAGIGLALPTVVAGWFGMNVTIPPYFHPGSVTSFSAIVFASFGAGLTLYGLGVSFYHFRYRSIGMRVEKLREARSVIRHFEDVQDLVLAALDSKKKKNGLGERRVAGDLHDESSSSSVSLGKAEFRDLLRSVGYGELTPEDVDRVYNAFDSDGSGMLDETDIVQLVSQQRK